MQYNHGPTGQIVRGSLFDVNPKSLEKSLKSYDEQLYLKWNPKKRNGWGVWELRRRPNEKFALPVGEYEGATFRLVDYYEIDIENHILDLPVLSYSVLEWLKAADTFQNKNWVNDLEYMEAKHKEKVAEAARKERTYNLMQFKSQIRGLKELILSGRSPAELAKYWGSSLGPK